LQEATIITQCCVNISHISYAIKPNSNIRIKQKNETTGYGPRNYLYASTLNHQAISKIGLFTQRSSAGGQAAWGYRVGGAGWRRGAARGMAQRAG
jgi:hypothetical protein